MEKMELKRRTIQYYMKYCPGTYIAQGGLNGLSKMDLEPLPIER